jgi:uncharacterized membrane protein YdjX (TVP38/TMEM64 family)
MRAATISIKGVLALVVALVISAGIVGAAIGFNNLAGGTKAALRWAQTLDDVGWVVLAVLQICIAASGVLPASLAGMVAGALYGIGFGFGLAAVSTMIGAFLTLMISRSLARGWMERFIKGSDRLRNLDGMLAENGASLVCLLRLSPVMPFAATSYALGLSSVTKRDYMFGTLASLPALLGYVIMGKVAAGGVSSDHVGWLHWSMTAVGIGATVALALKMGSLLIRVGLVSSSVVQRFNVAAHRPTAPGGVDASVSMTRPDAAGKRG